ncbi:MAG: PTS transporter subunit EIIA [Hungatella sp.]|nr:PTS transporter subunit EIIA [Hungatella sp.]
MENRLWTLLDALSENYKTSKQLGEELRLSEKTIRTRIRELEQAMEDSGAIICSKPRYGYRLKVEDRESWEQFQSKRYKEDSRVPMDSGERVDYMLALFLNRTDYIKLEDLSDFLYVSPKTLTNELKRVEYILECFSLKLERKPYYGIRTEGLEFDKRCCILQNFYLSQKPFWKNGGRYEKDHEAIAAILLELTRQYDMRFTEIAFQNTVFYIALGISRMKKGFFIGTTMSPIPDGRVKREVELAVRLYEQLDIEEKEHIRLPWAEIYFTAVYIAGRRILELHQGSGEQNMVAGKELDGLVSRILEEIYLSYGVELRDNLNLRIMLIQHLVPMEIRVRYGIPVENVPDRQIKEAYILAYSMAQVAAGQMAEYYKKPMPEDEVFCMALYFAMALDEKKMLNKRRNRILLICVSGKASSRLLKYRFQKEFGEYIDSLEICGVHELEQVDFGQVDFVFTTVPVYRKVSVPIMEIHDFLESGEIMSIRHFLQAGGLQFLNKYYKKELFFSRIPAKDKLEAIHEICIRMADTVWLPEGFEESVLEREEFGATDFGNLTAIPHPRVMMTKETVVAVAVLEKPILWSSNMVQVVVLTSLNEEDDEETQQFYEVTAAFLSDKEAVEALIREPEFENFEKRITALKR